MKTIRLELRSVPKCPKLKGTSVLKNCSLEGRGVLKKP